MCIRAARFKMTIVTLCQMALLLLMFTLTIPVPSHAATFFDTDFELGGSVCDWADNGWNDFGQAFCSGPMTISTDRAFSGTHALRLVFVTLDNTNSVTVTPSIYRSLGDQRHVFMRFAHYLASNFQISTTGHTKLIRLQSNLNSYPRLWTMYRHGTYQFCMEGPYDFEGTTECIDSGVAPNEGNWEQIEVEWQLNTPGQSNGLIRMWINGTLRIERLNRAYVGPAPTSRGLTHGLLNSSDYRIQSSQVYLQSGLGNMYYDRIAIGDTRIGIVGSQPVNDATPPAAPNGLRVQ